MEQGKGAGTSARAKTGFTIIEVMLFLAISGFLLVGILVGTGSGIARQRYNDSVQDIAQKLRSQYSAVINTQIPERDFDGGCNNLDPDDLMEGGKISGDKILQYFNTDGTPKDVGSSGRGRTNCAVYGLMMTFGGSNGTTIQTASLVGKDINELARMIYPEKIENLDDLKILQLSGVNNLAVFYENIKVNNNKLQMNNLECWVRTTNGPNASYTAQWGARIEKGDKSVLNATVIIFRSPLDGAVRTYVMDQAITDSDGKVFDFSTLNGMNGGKGYGLQNEGNGKCNGNIGQDKAGYHLYKTVGINSYITKNNFTQKDLVICVGSDDMFAVQGKRRAIRIKGDGHNSSAIELIDRDDPALSGFCDD